ncbi:MAG: hypothetical protein EOP51_33365 [Sphingobacteriales bacterium]|nr:MAG: hypothetical protein EOP51_33365 [Sphingobacteriales bacterium]
MRSVFGLASFGLVCLFCSTVGSNSLRAQTINNAPLPGEKPTTMLVTPAKQKKPKPIRGEFSGGFRLTSNGWGIFVDKGWVKSDDKLRDYFYNTKVLQIELSEKKNPKEIKRNNSLNGLDNRDTKPFIYGKINSFYAFKLGYGMRKMIAGKPENKTVSVHWVYLGGLTLGLQKPYYLETYNLDNGTIESIKYSKENESRFLGQLIVGSSGFAKGLNELQMIPGVHAKTALHFDFAASKKSKLALETGINAEYYSKKIELMAYQDAKPYFVDVYVSLQFGGRW